MSVCRPGALVDFARHKQSDPLPLPLRVPASQTTPIPSAGVGQSENQGLGSTVFMQRTLLHQSRPAFIHKGRVTRAGATKGSVARRDP
jgi:hypothetical protein